MILLLFLLVPRLTVQAEGNKTIRVGFPIQGKLTYKDEDGKYAGYMVDYLNEIKKYTGWKYEFVEVEGTLNEQLTTLLGMLSNGEIDLMGGMVYNESLDQLYDYPTHSYGTASTAIAVRKDDTRWAVEDFEDWNGIAVGIYPALRTREQQLQKFADINGFTYRLVEYNTFDEVLEAMDNGEIDATIQVDISIFDTLKSIGKFSPTPYYFATTQGNSEIVRDLNMALSNINTANPYLEEILYEKYFSYKDQFYISEENKEYVQSLGTVRVLMMDGNAPIHYYDESPKGISISYLEQLSKATGLQYEVITAENYEDFVEKIKSEDIDLILGVPTDSTWVDEMNLLLSIPYLESHRANVFNKHRDDRENQEQKSVYNTQSTLDAINCEKEKNAYLDFYCTNFYLQKKGTYNNIGTNINDTTTVQYTFGLVDHDEIELLSIINNFLSSVSDGQKQSIIYRNTVVNVDYSIIELLKIYSLQISIVVLIIAVIGILIYLKGIKTKSKIFKEIALQHTRFREMVKLMDECLFEYNYEEDKLKIQNNKVMFDRKNCVEHFIADYAGYDFLKEMIRNKEDAFYNFLLDTENDARWYRVVLKVIKDDKGTVTYALGKIYDVNDDMTEQKALIEQSKRDSLTGLFNRSGAEGYIRDLLAMKPVKGVLLLIDVDNFKLVNDHMGHPVGDRLLKKTAQFINEYFRDEDIKCRLGGDEFLIFIHSSIQHEWLSEKIENFLIQIQESVFSPYAEYELSLSIGAAFVAEDGDTYESLYQKADYAMYIAKHGGKNGFFISGGTGCVEQECETCKKHCRRRGYLARVNENSN